MSLSLRQIDGIIKAIARRQESEYGFHASIHGIKMPKKSEKVVLTKEQEQKLEAFIQSR